MLTHIWKHTRLIRKTVPVKPRVKTLLPVRSVVEELFDPFQSPDFFKPRPTVKPAESPPEVDAGKEVEEEIRSYVKIKTPGFKEGSVERKIRVGMILDHPYSLPVDQALKKKSQSESKKKSEGKKSEPGAGQSVAKKASPKKAHPDGGQKTSPKILPKRNRKKKTEPAAAAPAETADPSALPEEDASPWALGTMPLIQSVTSINDWNALPDASEPAPEPVPSPRKRKKSKKNKKKKKEAVDENVLSYLKETGQDPSGYEFVFFSDSDDDVEHDAGACEDPIATGEPMAIEEPIAVGQPEPVVVGEATVIGEPLVIGGNIVFVDPAAIGDAIAFGAPITIGEPVAVGEPIVVDGPMAMGAPVAVGEPVAMDESIVVDESIAAEEPILAEEQVSFGDPTAVEIPAVGGKPITFIEGVVIGEPNAAGEPIAIEEPIALQDPIHVEEMISLDKSSIVEGRSVPPVEPLPAPETIFKSVQQTLPTGDDIPVWLSLVNDLKGIRVIDSRKAKQKKEIKIPVQEWPPLIYDPRIPPERQNIHTPKFLSSIGKPPSTPIAGEEDVGLIALGFAAEMVSRDERKIPRLKPLAPKKTKQTSTQFPFFRTIQSLSENKKNLSNNLNGLPLRLRVIQPVPESGSSESQSRASPVSHKVDLITVLTMSQTDDSIPVSTESQSTAGSAALDKTEGMYVKAFLCYKLENEAFLGGRKTLNSYKASMNDFPSIFKVLKNIYIYKKLFNVEVCVWTPDSEQYYA